MDNNPPAFPSPACGDWSPEYGMTLLDWFAGQALNGLLAADEPGKRSYPQGVAYEAYECAAAMMAERTDRINRKDTPSHG